MKATKSSHIIIILKKFLAGEELSSSDMFASNANQYFCDIKNRGIELEETWKKNLTNNGRHKVRKLETSFHNMQKAQSYLNHLMGVQPKNNEKSSRGH